MSDRISVDDESWTGAIMPKINGQFVRCDCGTNVFQKSVSKPDRIRCNGCGDIYRVEYTKSVRIPPRMVRT